MFCFKQCISVRRRDEFVGACVRGCLLACWVGGGGGHFLYGPAGSWPRKRAARAGGSIACRGASRAAHFESAVGFMSAAVAEVHEAPPDAVTDGMRDGQKVVTSVKTYQFETICSTSIETEKSFGLAMPVLVPKPS